MHHAQLLHACDIAMHNGMWLVQTTGEALFAGDIKLAGMQHAALVTSTRPHAKLLSVDASAALQVATKFSSLAVAPSVTKPSGVHEQEVPFQPRLVVSASRRTCRIRPSAASPCNCQRGARCLDVVAGVRSSAFCNHVGSKPLACNRQSHNVSFPAVKRSSDTGMPCTCCCCDDCSLDGIIRLQLLPGSVITSRSSVIVFSREFHGIWVLLIVTCQRAPSTRAGLRRLLQSNGFCRSAFKIRGSCQSGWCLQGICTNTRPLCCNQINHLAQCSLAHASCTFSARCQSFSCKFHFHPRALDECHCGVHCFDGLLFRY